MVQPSSGFVRSTAGTDETTHTPRKDERIRLYSPRRKRRSHVFHTASVIGEKNDRTTPNSNEVQTRTASHRGFIDKPVLLFIGTCSIAAYLIFFGARYSLGIVTYVNSPFMAGPSTSTPAERSTSSQSAKTFIVDRSILDRLEHMHKSFGDLDELDIATWNGGWPPLITRIPEPRLPPKKSVSHAAAVGLCGPQSVTRRHCQFLLPYHIAEQESKARLHLLQLAGLAQALNRTLILPNVGKSRIGICLGWDFETYYDVSSLKELGVSFAKMDLFQAWVDSRRNACSATLMVIAEKSATTIEGQHQSYQNYHTRSVGDMPDMGCIYSRFPNLNFVNRGTIFLDVIYPRREVEIPYRFIGALQNAVRAPVTNEPGMQPPSDPEILVIDWNVRHAIFPSSLSALRYSPHLAELSREISPSGPYLAVHWRTETIPQENLRRCAYALVNKIRDILRDSVVAEGIGTVWLASDLSFEPLQNPTSKSGTLRTLSTLHQEAVRTVQASFQTSGELAEWKLQSLETSLNTSHSRNASDAAWVNDAGVRGILDKTIAAEATIFLSGTKRCSRVSSYTRQIIEMRKRSQTLGTTRQRNIVDLFG